ncbi:hypothetical protein TrLO_g12445 [Triparma laevis f. longispina]|uniref:Uncharacterized protein n=2 Tax=Triparma laevis TaxID=1534972 RepID=A0A9W7A8G2_9STRA|nr:hypothetical protein TrLO_g12445 [Triparma laevis f. longispina]
MLHIQPTDGSPIKPQTTPSAQPGLPEVGNGRQSRWPQGGGDRYEMREERKRREMRAVSRERQRRQKLKPFTGQHQPPHNPNISGPELLMTLNNPNPFPTQATSNDTSNKEIGEGYREGYRESFPMYDDEMPYSPESRLQEPGDNSPTLENLRTGSPMGSEGSPSLKGLQFESPGNNRSPPRQITMKSNDIFGKGDPPNQPQNDPVYSVNYFGVHHGEMGVLSHKRKIPKQKIRPKTGSKLDNNNIKHLTPFGQHLAQNVSSEMLPPNVRLDPSYVYLRSATTAPAFSEHINMYMNSKNEQQNTHPQQHPQTGNISPLHEGFAEPLHSEPVPFINTVADIPDDTSVNTQQSNLTTGSFERNQALSPSKTGRNQAMEQVDEDDRTLDSAMAQSHFSRSTLGVPNPGMYDQWLTNNALPGISRSLSRGGLTSGGLMWEGVAGLPSTSPGKRATSPPSNAQMHNKTKRLHSDHARKKYVEATAALAGYGDNEFLPLPNKLSELGSTMGLPSEFDRSLRAGNSGPSPKLFTRNPEVGRRSKEAARRAVERKTPKLKWRGLDSHRIQLKKVDAMLRSTLSSSNRPNSLVDPGDSVYGSMELSNSTMSLGKKVVKVGGKRVMGRKFKSQSVGDLREGIEGTEGEEEVGGGEWGGGSVAKSENMFSYAEMFGAGRII